MIPVFKYSNKLRENENYKKKMLLLCMFAQHFLFFKNIIIIKLYL